MQLSAVGDIELRILNMIKKPGKLYLDILVNLVKSPFLRGKGQLNADNVLPLDFMKIGNYSSYIINWEPAASSFNSQMSETQINFQKEIKSGTQWQTPIFYYFAQIDFFLRCFACQRSKNIWTNAFQNWLFSRKEILLFSSKQLNKLWGKSNKVFRLQNTSTGALHYA